MFQDFPVDSNRLYPHVLGYFWQWLPALSLFVGHIVLGCFLALVNTSCFNWLCADQQLLSLSLVTFDAGEGAVKS